MPALFLPAPSALPGLSPVQAMPLPAAGQSSLRDLRDDQLVPTEDDGQADAVMAAPGREPPLAPAPASASANPFISSAPASVPGSPLPDDTADSLVWILVLAGFFLAVLRILRR